MRFRDCIILAAGRGKRMQSELPKVLIEVNGKPVLQYVIDAWKPYVDRFSFVLGYGADDVKAYLYRNFPLPDIVIQREQRGIADAINNDILKARLRTGGTFVVALGDCINIGTFEFPDKFEIGYGLLRGNYQKQLDLCCSSWVENGRIVRVVEKGRAPYVGIGTYFLDRRVFDYIDRTPPSSYRDEIEITEVLQNMIDHGEKLTPVYLDGDFVNITYPEDIKYAEDILRCLK